MFFYLSLQFHYITLQLLCNWVYAFYHVYGCTYICCQIFCTAGVLYLYCICLHALHKCIIAAYLHSCFAPNLQLVTSCRLLRARYSTAQLYRLCSVHTVCTWYSCTRQARRWADLKCLCRRSGYFLYLLCWYYLSSLISICSLLAGFWPKQGPFYFADYPQNKRILFSTCYLYVGWHVTNSAYSLRRKKYYPLPKLCPDLNFSQSAPVQFTGCRPPAPSSKPATAGRTHVN